MTQEWVDGPGLPKLVHLQTYVLASGEWYRRDAPKQQAPAEPPKDALPDR
jgi:hypothetical protein